MSVDINEWGTFKDSLKAPVHRWFTYPAGFSHKAVEYSFREAQLTKNSVVYDPFMGSGTTNLVAKTLGINSIGVEAHPFVYPIAKCKMNWNIDNSKVINELSNIEQSLYVLNKSETEINSIIKDEFPELVLKCYLPKTLYEILIIRNYILSMSDDEIKLFMKVALIATLRDVSIAATGWPYIAPKKIKITSLSKEGFKTYYAKCQSMLSDLEEIETQSENKQSQHNIILGDSRHTLNYIENECVDHIFTSPPYLNNFDYADRTRLEMYVMGEAKSWKDITSSVRSKLITSATTQIDRKDEKYSFLPEFIHDCPQEYQFLSDATRKLSEIRLTKGGKKSYDLLVLGYMNDLYQVIKDNYRVLKKGSVAKYILGDSAPYGVHIPTDELIGKIGVNIGFTDYKIDILRKRGEKWKDNPQRHAVPLRESIVTLRK